MPPLQLPLLQHQPSGAAAPSGTRSDVQRTAAPAQQPVAGSRAAASGPEGSLQGSLPPRISRSSKARPEELLIAAAQQAPAGNRSVHLSSSVQGGAACSTAVHPPPNRRRHSAPQMQQATSPAAQAAVPASAAKADRVKGRVELSRLGHQLVLDGRRRIKQTERFEAVPSHVHNRLKKESQHSATRLRGPARRSSALRAQPLR